MYSRTWLFFICVSLLAIKFSGLKFFSLKLFRLEISVGIGTHYLFAVKWRKEKPKLVIRNTYFRFVEFLRKAYIVCSANFHHKNFQHLCYPPFLPEMSTLKIIFYYKFVKGLLGKNFSYSRNCLNFLTFVSKIHILPSLLNIE